MMVEKPASEPSMEDILASIRQIISGDAKGEENTSLSSKEEENILDLTEILPEDAHEMDYVKPSTESPSLYPSQPLTDSERALIEKLMEESEKNTLFNPLKEIPQKNIAVPQDPSPFFEDTLVSEAILSEAAQALSPLDTLIQEKSLREPSLNKEMGSQVLENLVRESLRPLLKEWLEAHLPSLVREIVSEQVEKIVHKR